MEFLEISGDRQLRLLGGEPTLHPNFIDIVTEGLNRKFHVHVFTNGLMDRKVADFLSAISKDSISVLCNVSSQTKTQVQEKGRRAYAFRRLGDIVQLGVTLTSPQFEYRYLIEYIKKYQLRKRIRIGIGQPIVGHDNQFLHPEDYRQTGKVIIEMVKRCVEEDILVGFDCGLTLCMFNEEEIGILMKCSEGFAVRCQPIIDVGPNLEVWHCFPLADVLITSLNGFANRNDLVKFYKELINPYKALGYIPECLGCKYLLRGQCTGGCLAHAMNSLNRLPPKYVQQEI